MALINTNTIKNMLRYKTETRPGLVALYDIRPGNGAGPFLQPRSPHGARQRGRPKKTWWDCVKKDMESSGLSQKDAQFRNKWRRGNKAATG